MVLFGKKKKIKKNHLLVRLVVPVEDPELDVLLLEVVGDTVLEVLDRVEDGTEEEVDDVTVVYGGRATALL